MSATSTRRVQKEFADIQKTPIDLVSVSAEEDNILKWNVVLAGPASSPYKGGKFKLTIEFPVEYPFKAPLVKFQTKMYHPNIDDEGNICIGLLKTDAWKPATKMSTVLLSLSNLLAEPNPDDPLVSSIAEQYKTDRPKFDETAKSYTKKHAH